VSSIEGTSGSKHPGDSVASQATVDTFSKPMAAAASFAVSASSDTGRDQRGGALAMIATAPRGQYKSSAMLPIFRLRLRNGASIGPALLKRLWSLAAQSEEIGVSRDMGRPGHVCVHHTYVVSARGVPWDVATVETNLRSLLQERLSAAHVELTRLI